MSYDEWFIKTISIKQGKKDTKIFIESLNKIN